MICPPSLYKVRLTQRPGWCDRTGRAVELENGDLRLAVGSLVIAVPVAKASRLRVLVYLARLTRNKTSSSTLPPTNAPTIRTIGSGRRYRQRSDQQPLSPDLGLPAGKRINSARCGSNALLSVDEAGDISVVANDFLTAQTMPDLQLVSPIGAPQTAIGLPPGGEHTVSTCTQRARSPVERRCVDGVGAHRLPRLGSARVYDVSSGQAAVIRKDLPRPSTSPMMPTTLFVLEYATNGLPGLPGFAPGIGKLIKITSG